MPSLTALQERVLAILAGLEPPWTLTGGAALAGVYLGHRTTRDLDLFWHGQSELGGVEREVERGLRSAGLAVDVQQSAPAFSRLRVAGAGETVVVDLIAEPVPNVDGVLKVTREGVTIQVDSRHEILVNKLCALLHHSELRDLVDVQALLVAGGDLGRALQDAPRKDGGFSPLMLAWVLRGLRVLEIGAAAGMDAGASAQLDRFRAELVERLLAMTKGPDPT
jgi:hypothetical protein